MCQVDDLELRKERVELSTIIKQAVDITRPLMEERRHTFSLELPAEIVYLDADPDYLPRLFITLLSNAVRHTPHGGEISLKVGRSDENIAITVRDNGAGIAPDQLETIFAANRNGADDQSLSFVKAVTDMHGGSILAENAPGEGSQFTVTLKPAVSLGSGSEPGTQTASPADTLRVLVVDDNEASAKTMGWTLELLGHDVRTAHDGINAINEAKNFLPHLVLLDIGLPGMNGYDVCRAMHEDPRMAKSLFVAQTGWSQEQHRRLSKEAGFDHHLVKPVSIDALQQLLASITPEKRAA